MSLMFFKILGGETGKVTSKRATFPQNMCHMDPSLIGSSHVVEFANNRSVKYQQAHAVTLSGDSF